MKKKIKKLNKHISIVLKNSEYLQEYIDTRYDLAKKLEMEIKIKDNVEIESKWTPDELASKINEFKTETLKCIGKIIDLLEKSKGQGAVPVK